MIAVAVETAIEWWTFNHTGFENVRRFTAVFSLSSISII